jgi:hypothetical protein
VEKLTPLGRRICTAQARVATYPEDVGLAALKRQLMCDHRTAVAILTKLEPTKFLPGGAWSHLVDRICSILHVDRDWLFDIRIQGRPDVDWEVTLKNNTNG